MVRKARDLDLNTFSRVLGSLYDAAADPDQWGEVLARLTHLSGAETAVVQAADSDNLLNSKFEVQHNIDPQAQREYNEYYHQKNQIGPRIEHILRSQGFWAGNSEDVCPLQAFKMTEFANDYAMKYGLFWGSCLVVSSANAVVALSLCQPESAGSLGARGRDLVELLLPHFQRVIHLHRSLAMARAKAEASRLTLDHFDTAVFALDGQGRVVSTNALAEQLLRLNIIALRDRKLHLSKNQKDARTLEMLISKSVNTGAGRGIDPGGTLRVVEPTGELIFYVTPFRSDSVLLTDKPCAIVFITVPHLRPRSRANLLTTLFALSPAEARVAHLVATGCDLREIADETHTSLHTVRTQLKSAFRKTGTSKQSQLVRLVLNLPTR